MKKSELNKEHESKLFFEILRKGNARAFLIKNPGYFLMHKLLDKLVVVQNTAIQRIKITICKSCMKSFLKG